MKTKIPAEEIRRLITQHDRLQNTIRRVQSIYGVERSYINGLLKQPHKKETKK